MTTNLTFFRRCLFTLLGILMGVVPTLAAPLTIRGIVTASDSVPLDNVAVTLLALPDSVYVAGTTTDAQGQFVFNDVDGNRRYLLSANSFGYEPAYAPASAKVRIDLRPVTNELAEVIVTGKAPVIKSDAGKFTIIPNELVDLSKSGFHLLSMTPMVSISGDKIDIMGKPNCKLYINGKEPLESKETTIEKLKELPPEYIKRIELITAPGASQDGNFAGGIVNVIIDDPREGVIGFLNANVDFSTFTVNPDLKLNIDTRKGKLSTSTMVSYQNSNTFSKKEEQYFYPLLNKYIDNQSSNYSHFHSVGGAFTAIYSPKENIDLGASIGLGSGVGHSRSTTLTLNRENGVETPSYYRATGSYPWQNPSISGVLYFAMLTDKYGSNLNVRGDYSYNQSDDNKIHDFDGDIIPDDNKSLTEVFRAKANYKLKRESFSLDFGYQIYGIRKNNRRDYDFERDDFRNHDLLNSVFAQLDWTCSNTVSVSGGLRMEHTHNTIEQRSTSEHFTRNYVNWVPNASVSFTLPQGRFIAVNFSPFLVRPYYSQMNPYKKWSSENAYSMGNPNLKTYVSWDGNIYAQIFSGFTVNLNLSFSDDSYCMYTINDGEGNAVSSYANEGRDEMYSLGFGYSKTLFSIWTLNAHMYASYRNRKAIIDTQDLGFEDWSGSFSLSNNILISRTYGLYGQVSYSIHTPTTLISEKNSWKSFLGCSISKTFNFGLDIDFTAFSTIGSIAKSYSNPEFSYYKRMRDSPIGFYLSLSYKFGKKTVKKTQNIGSSGDMRKG